MPKKICAAFNIITYRYQNLNCDLFLKPLQWRALENQQSPFYVVNEVTLVTEHQTLRMI